jgi:hypothetical protein
MSKVAAGSRDYDRPAPEGRWPMRVDWRNSLLGIFCYTSTNSESESKIVPAHLLLRRRSGILFKVPLGC